jgi:SAM-dependent methyltransferase
MLMANTSRKLHLGCGRVIKEGWLNTDIVKLPGVDVVFDLEKTPYPFKENQFLEVEAHHTFEHVGNFMEMMEELNRICAPGAIVRVSVPYFASPSFWRDPTHKRPFNIDTFTYFQGCWYSKSHFIVRKRKLIFFSCRSFMKSRWYSVPIDFLINLSQPVYQRFFVYLLPASELHFVLEVQKEKKGKKKK